ncbi:DUF1269 domain-containing protein [Nonomuraea longicatena]|uniref:DUF1269 domain-containing protein n=1 Tax=Nonomuraea longicatena TaxID=83682 RepID=A0ABP3Z8T5_9ACTN
MSNLIVISYPDVATAETVRNHLFELQKQNLIQLEDAAIVEHLPDGKIKLHQIRSTVGIGAAGGALWGGLIGLLFFMPLFGMAVGAAAGAAGGAVTDSGVNNEFMRELGEKMPPGTAGLFLLVVKSTPDKVIEQVGPYGGEIIKTSLSTDQEKHLKEAVAAAKVGHS